MSKWISFRDGYCFNMDKVSYFAKRVDEGNKKYSIKFWDLENNAIHDIDLISAMAVDDGYFDICTFLNSNLTYHSILGVVEK